MELWNRYTSSTCSLNQIRGTKLMIRVILTCYILSPIVINAETCGACSSQKKFVWTTAWPMEENYVTYKLIGPLIDKSQQVGQPLSLSSSSPSPEPEEGDKSVPPITESNERFERVGLKTEVELDELPSKMDSYNSENQDHNCIISLVNPINLGNLSHTDNDKKNIPLSQKVVFSAHRPDTINLNAKQHTMELVSKTKKGTYVSAKGNTNQNLSNITSKVVSKLSKDTSFFPDLVSKVKGVRHCPEKLHKVRRVPTDRLSPTSKILPSGNWQRHRSVAKKNHQKSKPSASVQFTKRARNAGYSNDVSPIKIQPLSKRFLENPSNTHKISVTDPGNSHSPTSINDSSDLSELNLSSPALFSKRNGRFPNVRVENSSPKSRFTSFPRNVMKGCNISSNENPKGLETTKEIKSETKDAWIEDAPELSNIKNTVKSGNVRKKMDGKREKQIINGEKSTKKRRENYYSREIKDKNPVQRNQGTMQSKVRKIPFRYRLHSMSKLSGITSDNNSSFLSWFKDLSPPLTAHNLST